MPTGLTRCCLFLGSLVSTGKALAIILKSLRGLDYCVQERVAFLSEVLIDCHLRKPLTDKSNTTIIQYFFLKTKPLAFY